MRLGAACGFRKRKREIDICGRDRGSAGAVRDADRRRSRDRPPQDCGGTGVFRARRGDFGGGTRRAAAQETKMAAVRLPPVNERSLPPPRRAKHNPALREQEREQRRARQPSRRRDNERLGERWRGSWARPYPRERSERIVRPAYAMRPPRKVFHTVETFFPYCGKIANTFSILWKTPPPSSDITRLRGCPGNLL